MTDPQIEKIIIRYLNRSSTLKDLQLLEVWLEDREHQKEFDSYVKTHFEIVLGVNAPDSSELKERLSKSIRAKQKRVIRFSSPMKYAAAAIILLLLSTPFLFKEGTDSNPSNTPHPLQTIVPGGDKAILTLTNGQQISLEKGSDYRSQNAQSNGKELLYSSATAANDIVGHHYLSIPRGGQFFLKLSDGTKVWLNSESKIKYPIRFDKNSSRKVELLYGEAYFDVAHSTLHNGTNFIVNTKGQDVEVLGTEFNIRAYKEHSKTFTTLIEGKVNVKKDGQEKYLDPGHQSITTVGTQTISTQKVNVFNEIAWKNGVFIFEDKTIKEILTVLSRWYDIEVVFADKTKESLKYSGILKREDSIDKLLISIEKIGQLKFELHDKEIIVK